MNSEPQFRILHVVSALTRTGPARNVVDFVCRARSRNWDSMVLVIKDADPGLLKELQNAGCECAVLGQRTILPTPRMMAQVARRIWQYDPDLLQISQCGLPECAVRVAARMSSKHAVPIVSLVQTRARDYYLSDARSCGLESRQGRRALHQKTGDALCHQCYPPEGIHRAV